MNDKKNCIVLYYKSTESWLNKIPKNINVLKKIELKEDDTIENINEKIKNNFCVISLFNSPVATIELIIFLDNFGKINIEDLFSKNNFALFLPPIIQVNAENKLKEIETIEINTIEDIKHSIITEEEGELKHDLISYFKLLEKFWCFFGWIHRFFCIKDKCKIQNIDYESYNDENLPSNYEKDVEDVFKKIKSIGNLFGFFNITNEREFIFNLEYAFKYNIIITAFNVIKKELQPKYSAVQFESQDYISKIHNYYELPYYVKLIIKDKIIVKKIIKI